MKFSLPMLFSIVVIVVVADDGGETTSVIDYGVDVSFPIHHYNVTSNYPWLSHNLDSDHNPTPLEYENTVLQPLGDKESWYQDHIKGCVDYYNNKKDGLGDKCLQTETERVDMSLRQPQSVLNYTKYGYTKIRAPEHVFEMIQNFWLKNRDFVELEDWPAGNTYTNHWKSPSYMVSIENSNLEGGGLKLKQSIWNAARDTISEWTGQQLAECSLYGIRIYKEGSILAPHVDRLPLVASAIINVDQDVDEPWPLEVIGHDGRAHNVTMLPGDLVLYESHSIIHGRQFPLKGRFMANIFIHFEPIGEMGMELDYEKTNELPPYVIPGSLEESNWRSQNPSGHKIMRTQEFGTGSTTIAHKAAQIADLQELKRVVEEDEELVFARDSNGWTPLHESVRAGDIDVVQYLMEKGSDVNARTGENDDGGSVLYYAKVFLGEDHAIVRLLQQNHAKHYEPGEWREL